MEHQKGSRFVPISMGVFVIAIAILLICFWPNIFIYITSGVLIIFGASCLKVGFYGSQKLIDEMTSKRVISTESVNKLRKINNFIFTNTEDMSQKVEMEREKQQKLWTQFQDKENSNETLIKKAKALAPLIISLVDKNTVSTFKQLEQNNKQKLSSATMGEVHLEMIIFCIHFIDRVAFQYLGAELRGIFCDTLFVELMNLSTPKSDVATFRSIFSSLCNKRTMEYSKYKKIFSEENELPNDTLLWEFGKKIAETLGFENNITIIMSVYTIVFSSLITLHLPELFSPTQ